MQENNIKNVETEKELNEILRLRREKLSALKESGNDPYVITKFDFNSDSCCYILQQLAGPATTGDFANVCRR